MGSILAPGRPSPRLKEAGLLVGLQLEGLLPFSDEDGHPRPRQEACHTLALPEARIGCPLAVLIGYLVCRVRPRSAAGAGMFRPDCAFTGGGLGLGVERRPEG